MRQFNIQEELKKLPDKPGVYLMHDADDHIIYVGKAVILRNRVRSYFRESTKKTVKIRQMVSRINWFEYVVTDSEMEALVLENNLIKEHQPKYNTMLKDDKTYPYIKVTIGERFPGVYMTRNVKKDGAKYFGPFTSATSVKETLELLRKLYRLKACRGRKTETCLYYHIGQCDAPCIGKITQEAYLKNVEKALDFLNGNYKPLLRLLKSEMEQFAETMEYERAAETRDLYRSVSQLAQKQKITDLNADDQDILAIAREQENVIIQVFFSRSGKIMGREHFYMQHTEDESDAGILKTFIEQYYSGTPSVPKELVLSHAIEEQALLEAWLGSMRGAKVTIRIPVKGKKEKLVELAQKNAQIVLRQDLEKIRKEIKRTSGAVAELEALLDLSGIERMEAFDISNISGFDSVGSMVVYENGRPKRNDYRKFKIKSVEGPNDYASMEEVLTRRFEHGLAERESGNVKQGKFVRFPDLILMDGGRGQVNIAEEILRKLGLSIPVCGMVKDDRHRTRGLYFQNEEIPMDPSGEGFKLITRIQDEAHRFAITFHRNLRSKGQTRSVLDEIPQVGPKRRLELMRHFAGIEELKAASVEELAKVPGMNERAAGAVYEFFHKDA